MVLDFDKLRAMQFQVILQKQRNINFHRISFFDTVLLLKNTLKNTLRKFFEDLKQNSSFGQVFFCYSLKNSLVVFPKLHPKLRYYLHFFVMLTFKEFILKKF